MPAGTLPADVAALALPVAVIARMPASASSTASSRGRVVVIRISPSGSVRCPASTGRPEGAPRAEVVIEGGSYAPDAFDVDHLCGGERRTRLAAGPATAIAGRILAAWRPLFGPRSPPELSAADVGAPVPLPSRPRSARGAPGDGAGRGEPPRRELPRGRAAPPFAGPLGLGEAAVQAIAELDRVVLALGAAPPGDDRAGGGDAGDPGEADELPGDAHRTYRTRRGGPGDADARRRRRHRGDRRHLAVPRPQARGRRDPGRDEQPRQPRRDGGRDR